MYPSSDPLSKCPYLAVREYGDKGEHGEHGENGEHGEHGEYGEYSGVYVCCIAPLRTATSHLARDVILQHGHSIAEQLPALLLPQPAHWR